MLLGTEMANQEFPLGKFPRTNWTMERLTVLVRQLVHFTGLFAFERLVANFASIFGWEVHSGQMGSNRRCDHPTEIAFSLFGSLINDGVVFLPIVFRFQIRMIKMPLFVGTVNQLRAERLRAKAALECLGRVERFDVDLNTVHRRELLLADVTLVLPELFVFVLNVPFEFASFLEDFPANFTACSGCMYLCVMVQG